MPSAAVDAAAAPVEWFVLNAESNVEVDLTGLDAVEDVRAELARRGTVFAMARVKQELLVALRAAGLVDRDRRRADLPHSPHGGGGLRPLVPGTARAAARRLVTAGQVSREESARCMGCTAAA